MHKILGEQAQTTKNQQTQQFRKFEDKTSFSAASFRDTSRIFLEQSQRGQVNKNTQLLEPSKQENLITQPENLPLNPFKNSNSQLQLTQNKQIIIPMSQQYQMFLPNKIKKGQNFQMNHEFFKSPSQRKNIKVVSQTLQEEHESYLGIKQNKNSSRLSSQQSHFQISRNSIPIIKSLQNDITQENTNPNSKLSSSQSTRFLQDLQQHLRIQSPPTYLSLKPRKLEIYNNNLRGGSKLFMKSQKIIIKQRKNQQAKLDSQRNHMQKYHRKNKQKLMRKCLQSSYKISKKILCKCKA
eukprot:403341647